MLTEVESLTTPSSWQQHLIGNYDAYIVCDVGQSIFSIRTFACRCTVTCRQQYMKEDVCWAAFRVFDRNGDGHISKDELKQARHASGRPAVALLRQVWQTLRWETIC